MANETVPIGGAGNAKLLQTQLDGTVAEVVVLATSLASDQRLISERQQRWAVEFDAVSNGAQQIAQAAGGKHGHEYTADRRGSVGNGHAR